MTASCLRNALLALSLAWGAGTCVVAAPANPAVVVRPTLSSLTVTLEDGRHYSLTPQELADPKGGAIFWGDWAVANLLVPHYLHNRDGGELTAGDVLMLWSFPGPSGQRPPFLVLTGAGPVNSIDPGDIQANRFDFSPRTQVTSIVVGYVDGRTATLSQRALRDRRSGVLVWNDHAVASLFIPFYLVAPNLPTHPEDVLRTWTQPVTTRSRTLAASTLTELPGFLIKPMCIPGYPGMDDSDAQQQQD